MDRPTFKPLPDHGPNDWPEDFPHENGNYVCRCHYCDVTFYGHKRRIVCKTCATARTKGADQ